MLYRVIYEGFACRIPAFRFAHRTIACPLPLTLCHAHLRRRVMSVSVLFTSESELSPSLEAEWLNDLPPARRAQIGRWPVRRDRHRSLLASRLLLAQLRRLGHPRERARHAALSAARAADARPAAAVQPVALRRPHRRCASRPAARSASMSKRSVACRRSDFALYLNAAERAWAGRSARRFCSVWTRKEAVAKAAGTAGLPSLPRGRHHARAAPRGLRRAALADRAARPRRRPRRPCRHRRASTTAVTFEHLPAEALL